MIIIIFLIVIFSAFYLFVLTFTKGKNALQYLFYFWLMCFHFGPRGANVFGMQFYYLEIITWVVFIIFSLRFNIFYGYKKIFPKYTFLLFVFFVIGLITAYQHDTPFADSFSEFKVFFVMLPTFYITKIAFTNLDAKFEKILKIFIIGAFILTLGGVLFYFFPSLEKMLPLSAGSDTVLISTKEVEVTYTQEAFRRGGGSFWGLLLIAAYLVLLFFPSYINSKYTRDVFRKNFSWIVCGLILLNVIINGHRTAWMGFLIGWIFLCLRKGIKGIYGFLTIALILIPLLPRAIISRFHTIFTPSDIIWTGRVGAYQQATETIFRCPLFGIGWGGSGWVHNIILQFGANLGIPAAFCFFLWLGNLFIRSLNVSKKSEMTSYLKDCHIAFLAGTLSYLPPMIGETVFTWPSFMIPYWFFCAVLHCFNNGTIGSIEKDKIAA